MNSNMPIVVHSWKIIDESKFIKEMDKSSFIHNGTGIPKKIIKYWIKNDLKRKEKIEIEVLYENTIYSMKIIRDIKGRYKLIWNADFSRIIKNEFNELYTNYKNDKEADKTPKMLFNKVGETKYEVEFIEIVFEEAESNSKIFNEGSTKYYYGKRYERDKNAREEAIKLHGLDCKACGFNFERKYGEIGENFIEIHHTNPLFINQKEVTVNVETDLVPVCSNCHRMIHRKQHEVLSIDNLQEMISKNRYKY